MQIHAGTSGYSYKEWKGHFYPPRMAAAKLLAFYGERLPSVEINNTFYRLPKPSVLEGWAAQVPEHFRFVIKASRRITHFKRLKDAGDETRYLVDTVQVLGHRMGALLFQLPPNLRADPERLDPFLDLLPEGTRAAFEFRHYSWMEPAILERLRARNHALVAADTEDEPLEELTTTADWSYLRLRRPNYDTAALRMWIDRLRTSGAEEAFVFFKHEDEAAGPRMAQEFLALADEPVKRTQASSSRPRAAERRKKA